MGKSPEINRLPMYVDDTIAAAGIFICWQVSAIGAVLLKGRKNQIPRRSWVIFLIAGAAIALARLAAFWYLTYCNRHGTVCEHTHASYLFLLPEGGFAGVLLMRVPVRNELISAAAILGSLIGGSFLWALPLVIWLTPKKGRRGDTILDHSQYQP